MMEQFPASLTAFVASNFMLSSMCCLVIFYASLVGDVHEVLASFPASVLIRLIASGLASHAVVCSGGGAKRASVLP